MLTEVIAVALHCKKFPIKRYMLIAVVTKQKHTQLLGSSERDYMEVIRWMSFVNSEVQPHLANWFKPLVGRRQYIAEDVQAARGKTNRAVSIIEDSLQNTYLIGANLTLADLFAASSLSRGFQYVFDAEWQQAYPEVTKWFKHIVSLPIWRRVIPEPVIVTKAVEYYGSSAA